ncbi:hypothetical protein BRADI_3g20946v3 [Brachypodium distachyon]|uniref:Uncharacterized protein n=1 Tax=Brachypodium distachyon TaxID=15368 RepID=A0A0Q3LUR2_BRADI|nr:hypothetical protein BRADI_3g20946v3 [Brachypodium distachyon]
MAPARTHTHPFRNSLPKHSPRSAPPLPPPGRATRQSPRGHCGGRALIHVFARRVVKCLHGCARWWLTRRLSPWCSPVATALASARGVVALAVGNGALAACWLGLGDLPFTARPQAAWWGLRCRVRPLMDPLLLVGSGQSKTFVDS